MADAFYSQSQIDNKRRLAQALMESSMSTAPIQSWTQGAAQLAKALVGGMANNQAQEIENKQNQAYQQALMNLPGLGGGQPAQAAPQAAPQPNLTMANALTGGTGNAANAIASIESGGRYDAMGPETGKGRAIGKYQVMDFNVGPWTKTHLGQELTPEQFKASPQAQDAVFRGQFGQYQKKYGDDGAARAWFAGEGGMNNPNAKDILGTTVSQYGQKFAQALSGQTPQAAPQAPQQPQMAPDIANQIRTYMGSRDPRLQQLGMQLYQQYAKPKEQWVDERDPTSGSFYQRNTMTGERKVLEKSDVLPQQAFEQKLQLAAASKPQTTIDQRGESEFSKEAGKGQAKRFNELAEDGAAAQQMVSDVQTLQKLGKTIGTGKEAQFKAAIGPYADALGVKVDKLNDIQAFEAIVNRVAPTLRVKGSGAQSDFELKNFMKSMPSLGNTPEGNAMIAQTLQGLSQNKIKAAEIGSQALSGAISRDEAEKRLRSLPDPMEGFRNFQKTPAADGWQTIEGVKIRRRQ